MQREASCPDSSGYRFSLPFVHDVHDGAEIPFWTLE